jgi:hypothetical protein
MADESPEAQLAAFMARFTPEIATLGRESLDKLRTLVPPAVEMVYDNYNALVIGFCPTERPSEGIFSIAMYARSVALCFLQGAGLPDPRKRLRGSGNTARHIVLGSAADLDDPAVRELISQALARAVKPFDGTTRSRLVIKSISAKQRPRRPA